MHTSKFVYIYKLDDNHVRFSWRPRLGLQPSSFLRGKFASLRLDIFTKEWMTHRVLN